MTVFRKVEECASYDNSVVKSPPSGSCKTLYAILKDDMTPEQKLNEAHKLIQSGLYADSIKILNELATSSQYFNIS